LYFKAKTVLSRAQGFFYDSKCLQHPSQSAQQSGTKEKEIKQK